MSTPAVPTPSWTPSDEAAALVASLELAPHPEGGWFRRTWTAPARVMTANGERATASGILFVLDDGQEAAWHKVISDELWLWHGPGALEIHLGGCGDAPVEDPAPTVLQGNWARPAGVPGVVGAAGEPRVVGAASEPGTLGPGTARAAGALRTAGAPTSFDAPPLVQFLVPAGTWQRTFARGGVAVATCIVSPEFSFEDWQLAQPGN
ncbi:cupin domain-containing protein [Schaalia sp. Marseille-Q2122]|uniref:cupin domain-containing protein n=1 Tax=Schaalia sp. Marseille-Q2122 TaxID=2736604 RepID=UPI00158965B3|nr:cupin domain-containing protein [Schaalia sp. Marseille-Q2122]